uniref:Acyl-[acyl-carrier-protein] hydrolase n=1 Tax=Elaeis guineensis var. tenera TaxID=51953 RepID=A0A6I9REU9_ELAGV|nr:palmitoyl-acyl carrier protein thioesterase, chloroplastic [Elaeis guineensis]XP_010925111.1 palmitoyl-acyl carrier protein thioesterase, chloroplastic [Elaeis guineensis]
MVASVAASSFFPVPSSSSSTSAKASRGIPDRLDVRGSVAKPASSSGWMQAKANARAIPKIDDTKVGLRTDVEGDAASTARRTSYNQLPDWSMLLAAIRTIFSAAEKQWTLLDSKMRRADALADASSGSGVGKMVENGLVYRQNFSIRSYEIGVDQKASLEALMNHFQETSLNHCKCIGLMHGGFGCTPQMTRRNLIWVVTKIRVHVDRYPLWGDVVQINTWISSSGKNGMGRDWHVHDCRTGRTIMRGTSVWVMMNKHTRRLSKFPEEVKAEIIPFFAERDAVLDYDGRKLPKFDDDSAVHVRRGLTPRWSDFDVNQHVNNVKYVGWILESVPVWMLESCEVATMTLEYRRECGMNSVVQSLTATATDNAVGSPIVCQHLLRLEDGSEIVRSQTEWRPKQQASDLGNMGLLPTETK